jgi:transcriptional regulator with XRE-family HTH domain
MSKTHEFEANRLVMDNDNFEVLPKYVSELLSSLALIESRSELTCAQDYYFNPQINRLPASIQPAMIDIIRTSDSKSAIKILQRVLRSMGRKLKESGYIDSETEMESSIAAKLYPDFFCEKLFDEVYKNIAPSKPTHIHKYLSVKVSSPEKKSERQKMLLMFGSRMREARNVCGFTAEQAAKLLGYENGSKLSKVENSSDTDSIPWWLPYTASAVYDVSLDYLFGYCDDWERDPIVYQQRELNQIVGNALQRTQAAQANAIRVLSNKMAVLQNAVVNIMGKCRELDDLVARMMHVNQSTVISDEEGQETNVWDELRMGNKLVSFSSELSKQASGVDYELKKYEVYAKAAKQSEGVDIIVSDIFENFGG